MPIHTVANTANPGPGSGYRQYTGPIEAAHFDVSGAPPGITFPPAWSNAALIGAGTKGIAMSTPNSPIVDLATFAGELRQIPRVYSPSKWKDAIKNFKKMPRRTAEDYLNFEFGWRPFIGELLDFCKESKTADVKLNNFVRNSGKEIRRKRTVLNNSDTTMTTQSGVFTSPALASAYYISGNTGTRITGIRTTTKAVFSGSFTYYLPKIRNKADVDKRRRRLVRYLTGAEVSPDVLWNLSPWSWAADWVGNIGDILHNLTAFSQDGLVMKYGYITVHQEVKVSWLLYGKPLKNGPAEFSQQCTMTRIQRVRATPYGFGLNPNSFSNRQWAIIGALGITRMPRSLDV